MVRLTCHSLKQFHKPISVSASPKVIKDLAGKDTSMTTIEQLDRRLPAKWRWGHDVMAYAFHSHLEWETSFFNTTFLWIPLQKSEQMHVTNNISRRHRDEKADSKPLTIRSGVCCMERECSCQLQNICPRKHYIVANISEATTGASAACCWAVSLIALACYRGHNPKRTPKMRRIDHHGQEGNP